jgi:hypothetical protein
MRRGRKATCARRGDNLQRRSILAISGRFARSACIFVALGLLGFFPSEGLRASASPDADRLSNNRSAQTMRRFTVTPNGVSLTTNQTQRFRVTDARGNSVAVRWSLGLECTGLTCGTIDARGNYHAPPSMSESVEITLEGVLVSDPRYSVLTRIRLVPAVSVISDPHQATDTPIVPHTQPLVDPQSARLAPELPISQAVVPPPTVQGSSLRAQLPLLPKPVPPAPAIAGQNFYQRADLVPLLSAISAVPSVRRATPAGEQLSPPPKVPAAPNIRRTSTRLNIELMLPGARVVAPPPAISGSVRPVHQELAPQPALVPPAPEIGGRLVNNADFIPLAASLGKPETIPTEDKRARPDLPSSGGATAPATEKELANLGQRAVPEIVSGAQAQEDVSGKLRVSYQDGQLKIDAESTTLAAVLALVATRIGTVIDIPSGSGQEPIVAHLGPGHPNDILTQLLNGSPFNFIIVNSPRDPNEPAQILLSLRGQDTESPKPAPAKSDSALAWKAPVARPDQSLLPQYDSRLKAPTGPMSPQQIREYMKEIRQKVIEKATQQDPGNNQ